MAGKNKNLPKGVMGVNVAGGTSSKSKAKAEKSKPAKRRSLQSVEFSTRPYGDKGYKLAAVKYVNQGIRELNLSPREQLKLKEKLTPIIERQIKNERNRSYMRAKGTVARENRERMASAKKKILGGK